MNNKFLLSVIFTFFLFSTTSSISKIYSGKEIKTNTIIDNQQIIEKGKPLLDIEKAPIVIFYDKTDQSLKFTLSGSDHPDSLLYHVIPGDRVSVRIAASITWDENERLYQYIYEVQSLEESKIPINMISTKLGFEPNRILSAEGWGIYQSGGHNSWSQFKNPILLPGNSVSGFGFQSSGPPKLGIFFIRGESAIYKESLDGWEPLEKISTFLIDLQRVECLTLIPAPRPEKIRADNWISSIEKSISKLKSNGYIPKDFIKNIRDILSNLHDQMYKAENPPFSVWNGYIESALADLVPYETKIEPEAWSYITENLKYMQRNKDIVWFGK